MFVVVRKLSLQIGRLNFANFSKILHESKFLNGILFTKKKQCKQKNVNAKETQRVSIY